MVERALSTATTGMMARETDIAVISHNLANISTNGFKKQVAEFQDLMYQVTERPGSATSDTGSISSVGLYIGLGTKLSGTYSMNTQGDLQNTGGTYDFAIGGTLSSKGFFKIDMPDGTSSYTRDGAFKLNANREITNSMGFIVSPGILVPQNTTALNVDVNGNLYAQVGTDTTVPAQKIGTFDIVDFPNPSGLQPLGSNLFTETPASGQGIVGVAGLNGFGGISQGYIETSNVVAVNELTDLITAQRGYELCSNIIKASDEMLQVVNRLKQ